MYQFLVFLSDKYANGCRLFCKRTLYSKIRAYGVDVISTSDIDNVLQEIQSYVSTPVLFNNRERPEQNILYIRLVEGYYFSDNVFNDKKNEIECELLFMLSGLFGVSSIKHTFKFDATQSQKIDASIIAKGGEQTVKHDSNDLNKEHSLRNEEYSNDGAKDFFCESWDILNQRLKEHMDNINPIFYPFYAVSRKLRLFAYKRYMFWINHYTYSIEHETLHEKSIFVRSLLYKYGIGLDVSTSNYVRTIDQYEIQFYDRDELHFVKQMNENRQNDVFARLRQDYVNDIHYMRKYHDKNWNGDELKIFNQVIEYCREKGKIEVFDEWRSTRENIDALRGKCHWFKNEIEVKNWLNVEIPGINIE